MSDSGDCRVTSKVGNMLLPISVQSDKSLLILFWLIQKWWTEVEILRNTILVLGETNIRSKINEDCTNRKRIPILILRTILWLNTQSLITCVIVYLNYVLATKKQIPVVSLFINFYLLKKFKQSPYWIHITCLVYHHLSFYLKISSIHIFNCNIHYEYTYFTNNQIKNGKACINY